jgi:hypothetical protein
MQDLLLSSEKYDIWLLILSIVSKVFDVSYRKYFCTILFQSSLLFTREQLESMVIVSVNNHQNYAEELESAVMYAT